MAQNLEHLDGDIRAVAAVVVSVGGLLGAEVAAEHWADAVGEEGEDEVVCREEGAGDAVLSNREHGKVKMPRLYH